MRNRNTLLKVAVATAILPLVLDGCATFHQAHEAISRSSATVSRDIAKQNALKNAQVVTTVNTPYLMGAVVHVVHQHALPALFHKTVHLSTSQPLSIGQFATQITQMTGLPIHVASQVTGYLEDSAMASESLRAMSGGGLPPLPGQLSAPIQPLPDVSSSKNSLMLNWNGPLSGLLNLVAARTGTFWKYEHGEVRFFLTETRAFTVDALPGTTALTANITNTGSNGSTAGGAGGSNTGNSGSTSQSASMSANLNIYKSIVAGIQAVLAQSKAASGGSTSVQVPTSVSANESTGQIIVTATPPELRAVSEYLKPVNAEMAKNVLIEVHVYSVKLDQSNNYNLNLNLAFSNLGGGVRQLNVQGPQAISGPSGQGSLSAGIITGPVNAKMVASALATQGNVSLVTSGSIIALNGQPTPLQVANMHSYVASSQTTQTAQVGSSTALTPGQYTTGFSGTFLPLVRGHRILLEYTINLTQNLGLQNFTSGGSTVQLPNLATQAFMQRVAIRSGQTLVLSGFEQTNDQVNRGGVGSAHFWGLGGGAGAIHDKTALVVVIHVVKLGS